MNPDLCFIKTLKGAEEIKTRKSGLPAELRSVLILIDGKRTLQQIEKQFSKIGNIRQLLEMLQADGFIQPQEAIYQAPSAPPPTTIPETALAPSLAKIKIEVGTQIKQHFGLMATPLLNQLDKCVTLDAVYSHIVYCCILLEGSFSPKKAAAFQDSVKPWLPK